MPDIKVLSEISGSVWKIVTAEGDSVEEEQTLMILESMKMEIPVLAPEAGTLRQILVAEGDSVAEGQTVAIIAA